MLRTSDKIWNPISHPSLIQLINSRNCMHICTWYPSFAMHLHRCSQSTISISFSKSMKQQCNHSHFKRLSSINTFYLISHYTSKICHLTIDYDSLANVYVIELICDSIVRHIMLHCMIKLITYLTMWFGHVHLNILKLDWRPLSYYLSMSQSLCIYLNSKAIRHVWKPTNHTRKFPPIWLLV